MTWKPIIYVLAALSFLGACGDPKPSKNRVSLNDTPVARVQKLNGQGTASASRGGETRPLDSGAQLYADDVITTVGDVVVEIRVFKNKAQLLLSKAKDRKLSETAAWAASKEDTKSPMFIDKENKDQSPKAAKPDIAPPSPSDDEPPMGHPTQPT